MKTKILILASDPKYNLGLNREIRDLIETIKKSPDRDRFIIEHRLAVRPQDLQSALLEEKPRIVHFCGHGEGERGLVIENDIGKLHLVSKEALADLFRHFSHQIECVLLNACYTKVQAEEIGKHINFVVGMNQPILDESAIAFSAGFYGALGAGESIAKAYDFGCNRIHLQLGESLSPQRQLVAVVTEKEKSARAVPEHLIPRLFTNKNLTKIERVEELSAMETETGAKGNTISFGNNGTINHGISQNFSSGTIYGGVQASTGNNNQLTMTNAHNIFTPEQKQNLVETANKIKKLLQQLEQDNPSETNFQKMMVVAQAVEEIENNPTFKTRVIGALKAAGIEAFKELIDHPLVNILMASIDGWQV
ncbi:MAG: CHAT domain-containing protein [Pleurocapsa sp. MO_226.B13]|nr:CHAT domain-containing protein [Pleurocapsa sp. MO_226.B13]